MSTLAKVDKPFLIISGVLLIFGFVIFSSGALALLAKEGSNYSNVVFSQTVFGLIGGTIAMFLVSRLDYKIWRKFAFYILLVAVIVNILVLIPGIGFAHGGATRWIYVGGVSFQTSEILKFAFILYFAAWAASVKDKVNSFKLGFLPLLTLLAVSAVL